MRSHRTCFAYVVQCDIPLQPIKVGHSRAPRVRFKSFLGHTPADHRLLGVTIDGQAREDELKAALAPTVIRGEWGLPNEDVAALIRGWVQAGEWFVPVDEHYRHIVESRVRERAAKFGYEKNCFDTRSLAYHWAADLLAEAEESDPTLGQDWGGFVASSMMPDLRSIVPTKIAA